MKIISVEINIALNIFLRFIVSYGMSLKADAQRTGIAAGVEFIACPARNCCPLKI
jgi:hypothetical protein